MEPRTRGGIAGHLASIRQAVTDWLSFEFPPDDQAGQDTLLLRLSTQDELTQPEVPEVLSLYRESKTYNIPIFDGSLMDLPYLFHLELNTCIDAEQEFHNLRNLNRILLEQYNARAQADTVQH